MRENLPFAKGRRFSRNIPDAVDSSYSESTYRRHTRQSMRLQQNPTNLKPLAVRDVPAEISVKPVRRQSIRPRSKMRPSSVNEPAQTEIRVAKVRPRVRTKISTTSALPDRSETEENIKIAGKSASIRPRLEDKKEIDLPTKASKSKAYPKIPEVSAGSRRRTRQSVALETSKPTVPIRRRELEARPTASVNTQRAIEIPALPSKFKDPKNKKEKPKKPRSKHFDAGLDNIGIESNFKIPDAPKPAMVPGRMGQTMGLDNRSIFDVTGAFSRKHLSTSMLTKTMSKRVFEEEDDYVPTEEVKRALGILKQDCAVTINAHLNRYFHNSILYIYLYFSLRIKKIEKIGEGVFGEVFMGDVSGQKLILKIIPIDGKTHINSSPQKPIREVLGEFLIASALETANLAGFCHVKKATVCKGLYAKPLRDAWEKFDKEKGKNEFSYLFVVIIQSRRMISPGKS